SKDYTDTATAAAVDKSKDYTDTATAAAVDKSKDYTDTATAAAVDKSKDYTDHRVDNLTSTAVEQSNSYTNEKYDQSINYAQNAANQTESNAASYTDNRVNALSHSTNQRFKQLNSKIDRAEKRLNAGVAGVTAIASIPYVAENSFSYGIGLGNYQNGNAIAGGVNYKTSPNTNVRLNVSWDSSRNSAVGIGFAGGW
ncbi:YadA-like family protein, partial [Enterobacter asburiae]|uniref:YadA-like family protein n=1 Tax=Enterobacter asburiae TaxID=61645 RepID=UPI0028787251